MKKYIFPLMAIGAITLLTACSSDDNEGTGSKSKQVITFTATQEVASTATKAAVVEDGKTINWEEGDKLSVLDGTNNNEFTLKSGATTTEGIFEGTALTATSYTAVYPYQSGLTLSGTSVENVTLPATQTATANGFDKNTALMMAVSTTKELSFKNAVGYIKVTPQFDCSKIELKAAGADEYLAGKGTLTYNTDVPSITFTSDQSSTITLNPADGGTSIAKDKAYYIAVPAKTLSAGWSISFTNADDSKVYTRRGGNTITFKRNTVTILGEFATDGDYWYDEVRGIVKEDQEVDMGLEVTISGTKYKVIFAKSNLTASGLAANESDFGNYFAWAATEPWMTAYTRTTSEVTATVWKSGKSEGYVETNAPYYNGSSYTKYTNEGDVLDMTDDAARVILGGEWQLPTIEIWQALSDANITSVYWGPDGHETFETIDGIQGMKITKKNAPSTYLFLPATGYFYGMRSYNVGLRGYYWSGTANSSPCAYNLTVGNSGVAPNNYANHCHGFSVRPVRLVEVK